MAFPQPGLRIPGPEGRDPLTLEAPLGGGAFGVVFSALDPDGEKVAVKFPQAGLFSRSEELAAFLNEVKAAQEIKHKHVLKVLHVHLGEGDVPPYLVMEFADGGTLAARIEGARATNEPFAPEVVVALAEQLVQGIAAINERMLHRDLKPDNILFHGDILKVGDFGLAKLIGAATRS